jgi:hypothetical protein
MYKSRNILSLAFLAIAAASLRMSDDSPASGVPGVDPNAAPGADPVEATAAEPVVVETVPGAAVIDSGDNEANLEPDTGEFDAHAATGANAEQAPQTPAPEGLLDRIGDFVEKEYHELKDAI